jgi:uncharacterized protein (DUF934 family)
MRKILHKREVVSDRWRYAGEPGDGPVLLTLAEAQAATVAHAGALPAGSGVVLAPGEEPAALLAQIARLALLVVRFEKAGEGRGFSIGQSLRQQYGYAGALRAAGAFVKRDQLFLLARCGFDEFELAAGEDPAVALGDLDRYSVAYQPASDLLVQPRSRSL